MVKIQGQFASLKVRPCVAARPDLIQLQDIRQTPQYGRFMEKLGWSNVTMKQCNNEIINVFIRKLPLFSFSILKILHYRPPLDLKQLKKIVKKHHVFFIKLQPFIFENCKWVISSKWKVENFSPDSSPLIPTKTIWFELTQSEGELIKQMKPKTRYNLRLAQKNNLKCQVISGDKITEKQLIEFHYLWSKNKPFNLLFKPSFPELKSLVESFGEKCFFIVLKGQSLRDAQGLPFLAGCLILTSKNMAAYWHNCSSREGKKLFAPTLYVWQAIKEAKRRQLKVFDFEGVWDKRLSKLNQGWKGFSRFKESFGGKIISFAWPQECFRFF